jgi:excisionase family DNA binding protein
MEEKEEKLVYTITQCAKLLGLSRATAYSLAREGRLPVIRISDRRLIVPVKAIEKMLAEAGKEN